MLRGAEGKCGGACGGGSGVRLGWARGRPLVVGHCQPDRADEGGIHSNQHAAPEWAGRRYNFQVMVVQHRRVKVEVAQEDVPGNAGPSFAADPDSCALKKHAGGRQHASADAGCAVIPKRVFFFVCVCVCVCIFSLNAARHEHTRQKYAQRRRRSATRKQGSGTLNSGVVRDSETARSMAACLGKGQRAK